MKIGMRSYSLRRIRSEAWPHPRFASMSWKTVSPHWGGILFSIQSSRARDISRAWSWARSRGNSSHGTVR